MLGKKPKSFHNESPAEGVFRPFDGTESRAIDPIALPEAEGYGKFEVPGDVLALLSEDEDLLRLIEDHVTARVQEALREKHATFLDEARQAAHAEGFKAGFAAGEAQLHAVTSRLDTLADQLVAEKLTLLHAHEREWCEAMLHLLRRFICPKPEALMTLLQAWIADHLASFADKGKVTVFLSPAEYAQVHDGWDQVAMKRWGLSVDAALGRGEVRIEFGGGGVFFSPEGELGVLETYLQGLLENEGSAL